MRFLCGLALVLLIAMDAQAQRGGHHGGGAPGVTGGHPGIVVGGIGTGTHSTSSSGFGNVVFPGGAPPPPGARVGPGYRPGFGGYGRTPRAQFPVAYPVPVPVYVQDPYAYQEQLPAPTITVVLPSPEQYQQQSAQRPVTINQYFGDAAPAQPQMIEYGEEGQQEGPVRTYRAPVSKRTAPAAAADNQVLFYVPLKDSSVYTAVAYWVEGETLHYITTQGQHNQVSVELVDRAVSDRLNRGSKVHFVLPAAKQ